MKWILPCIRKDYLSAQTGLKTWIFGQFLYFHNLQSFVYKNFWGSYENWSFWSVCLKGSRLSWDSKFWSVFAFSWSSTISLLMTKTLGLMIWISDWFRNFSFWSVFGFWWSATIYLRQNFQPEAHEIKISVSLVEFERVRLIQEPEYLVRFPIFLTSNNIPTDDKRIWDWGLWHENTSFL